MAKGKEKIKKEHLNVVTYKEGLLIKRTCGDVDMSVSCYTEPGCKKLECMVSISHEPSRDRRRLRKDKSGRPWRLF